MQTALPTKEDIARWKEVFAEYHTRIKPNRISGALLREYLTKHYPAQSMHDANLDQVVTGNILSNVCYARALPPGVSPEPVCFKLAREGAALPLYASQDAVYAGCDILVGIDLVSGYFFVEGSSILWDELYARRGLNEDELSNYYCVAEYVACLTRFHLLEQVLNQESV
jgi:hypothetical protein